MEYTGDASSHELEATFTSVPSIPRRLSSRLIRALSHEIDFILIETSVASRVCKCKRRHCTFLSKMCRLSVHCTLPSRLQRGDFIVDFGVYTVQTSYLERVSLLRSRKGKIADLSRNPLDLAKASF